MQNIIDIQKNIIMPFYSGKFGQCELKAIISHYPTELRPGEQHMERDTSLITWTAHGRLLCYQNDALVFLKRGKIRGIQIHSTSVTKPKGIVQLVACEDKIVFVLEKRKESIGEDYLFTEYRYEQEKERTKIRQNMNLKIFTEPVDWISKCGPKFVAIKRAKRRIEFFSRKCDEFTSFKLGGLDNPGMALAMENDAVIVSDCHKKGKIVKFEWVGDRLIKDWECHELVDPYFLCEDSHHNIYVASYSEGGLIYTVSPSGKFNHSMS